MTRAAQRLPHELPGVAGFTSERGLPSCQLRPNLPLDGLHVDCGLRAVECCNLLTALLFSALPVLSAAQPPPELRQAMRARLETVWKKDAMTWSRLTAEEFTVVVPEGRLQTTAERLAALKTEKPQPVHAVKQEQIHTYG